MKTKYTSPSRSAGSALMLVMIMCAVTLVIMAAVMSRTSTVSILNNRNNTYTVCTTVAQAATEKVYAHMAYDFQNVSLGQVTNNYSAGVYATNIPTGAENPYWTNFVFSDGQGNTNRIYVNYLTNYSGPLPSQYTNLSTTLAPIYRIAANVSMVGYPNIIGTAQEDVLLSLVPITTYAIFYNGPLEFTKCATMTVGGRTQCNTNIYVGTSATLTFNGVVTSSGTMNGTMLDGWTPSPWNEGTTFNSGYITNVPAVQIAIIMTNSHSIIDIPPNGESADSQQGQVRLYNQAHVQIVVTNLPPIGTNTQPTAYVELTLQNSPASGKLPADDGGKGYYAYYYTNWGSGTNFVSVFTNYPNATNQPFALSPYTNEPLGIATFLSLTNKFTDKREYQTNLFVTQIDVGAYANWLSNNLFIVGNGSNIAAKFPSSSPATILYIADRRNIGTNKLAAVRLVNGTRLPYNSKIGFTVATQNPLYVKANYNTTADGTHFALTQGSTTNNSGCTVPAALLCDAITILSTNFTDTTSSNTIGTASSSTTINAAIVTGNVPTTGTNETTFSGGVNNLMRLQENWSSSTLVLNTSIVVLWASKMATNQFRNPTGWSPAPINPYYSAPTRQWGFDPNFYNPALEPPGIPTALVPVRFNWTMPPPGTVTNNIGNW